MIGIDSQVVDRQGRVQVAELIPAQVRMPYRAFQEGIEELTVQKRANVQLVGMLEQLVGCHELLLKKNEKLERKLVRAEGKVKRLQGEKK